MVHEFQAIVMAGGRGSRMTELTAGRPKCLLPIGNKPMVWYPLQLLERTGIRDTILVVVEQVRSEVQTALEPCGLKIRLDIVSIPAAEDWGTADTLRFLSDRIKSDVLIVSCDMVTDVNLHPVLDVFRKHSAGIVALFFHPQPSDASSVTPGPKTKQKPERDLVGLDTETSRLVFLASISDFDDTVSMPRRLLRKHPNISMFSQLTDAHFYVIRKWVVDYLAYGKSFSTLKGEMIPYIIKKQSSRHNISKKDDDTSASLVDDDRKDLFHFAQEDTLVHMIRELSSYNDHTGDMKPAYHGDPIRCYAFLAPSDKFGIRANTVAAYCDINRRIKQRWGSITGSCELTPIHPTSDIKSTQIDDSCIVGEQSSIAEKTSIKSCNIGAHCQIEPKVRLTQCILMNGVKIQEGCILSNCVLCDEVEVCINSELKDCLVGSDHTVAAGAKHASEVLTDVSRLMEI